MAFTEKDVTTLNENFIKLIKNDWMLITASNGKNTNTMTASWGGVGELWGKDVSYIFVRPSRYTYEFIENSDYYTLCFFDDFKEKLAYLGKVSGRDEDKIKSAGLTVITENGISYFKEAKYVVICKKLYQNDIKKEGFTEPEDFNNFYPNGDVHTMFVGEIVKFFVNE